jgi:hypothetical protein
MTVFPGAQITLRADPQDARNPCITTPLDELSPLLLADQRIIPDPQHPSAVFLSIPETSVRCSNYP